MLYLCITASKIHREVRRRIVCLHRTEVSPIAVKGTTETSRCAKGYKNNKRKLPNGLMRHKTWK